MSATTSAVPPTTMVIKLAPENETVAEPPKLNDQPALLVEHATVQTVVNPIPPQIEQPPPALVSVQQSTNSPNVHQHSSASTPKPSPRKPSPSPNAVTDNQKNNLTPKLVAARMIEYNSICTQTRSGPVRLSIDRVERLQLEVPPSPSSPAFFMRSVNNSTSPRPVDRQPEEALSPYLVDFSPDAPRVRPRTSPTAERATSFAGTTGRTPDRPAPPSARTTASRTPRMRLASSNAFSPRARSFTRRDTTMPDRPESTPIWRGAGGRRVSAPCTERVESTGSRTPCNAPSTPHNAPITGNSGSQTPRTPRTPKTPRTPSRRFGTLTRGARRAFGSSTPLTPLTAAARRALTSPAGRVMTGGGSTPASPMLTMQEPFKLRSLERHKQAQKELAERERIRAEREKDVVKPFKARPMPDFNRNKRSP